MPAMRTWTVVWTGLVLLGCGEAAAPTEIPPLASPTRTAAQDRALRAMAMDIASARGCATLADRFLPLPDDSATRAPGALPTIDGRLWVSECRIARDGDRLSVHLAGRGWRWVHQARPGPFGSSFTVRGTVRFEAAVDFEATLDLRYDEATHRAAVALTPSTAPRAQVTPIGTLPIAPAEGWSGLIGGLGGLLGASPEARARPMLEAEAAAMLRRELAGGVTMSFDLCTGQLDATLGALGDGQAPASHPYEDDGQLWLDNARAWVHPGGLDLSGPWGDVDPGRGAALELDVDVEQGAEVDVTVLCSDEAARVAASYLASGVVGANEAIARRRASPGAPLALTVAHERCAAPHVLLSTRGERSRVRYRVRRAHERGSSLVHCE